MLGYMLSTTPQVCKHVYKTTTTRHLGRSWWQTCSFLCSALSSEV